MAAETNTAAVHSRQLDPQVKALLDQMAAAGGPPEPVGSVENRRLPTPDGRIPGRVYTPAGDGPFPVLVFYHGGGWVLGDLDSCDAICRALTNLAGCVVVSVDYRLAPEHKFPAAIEDCYAAVRLIRGVRPPRSG